MESVLAVTDSGVTAVKQKCVLKIAVPLVGSEEPKENHDLKRI